MNFAFKKHNTPVRHSITLVKPNLKITSMNTYLTLLRNTPVFNILLIKTPMLTSQIIFQK